MLSKLEGLMSALEIFANHLSRLSFDNSRVLSPWCSITLGSLKKDLLSLPCLFEQLTIAQKAGMIISAYQSIKIHSGKTFVYTSGLLVCLPIWRTIHWWRHTRTLYWQTNNDIPAEGNWQSYLSLNNIICCHTAIENLSDSIGYLLDFTNP
jgi:hypothetical protein